MAYSYPAKEMTEARISMMMSHAHLKPKQGVAHTIELGSIRTWHWLYDNGYLKGGRLTAKAIEALNERHHFVEIGALPQKASRP